MLENVSTLRRAGLLTSPTTHAKNVLSNATMQAAEEAARVPAALADMARVAVARAAQKAGAPNLSASLGTERRVGGLDLAAVGRASKEAATRGVREAIEILRTGSVANDRFDANTTADALGVDREYASHSRLLNALVNGVFRSLSAEDRLFRSYAFARSVEAQAGLVARAEVVAARRAGRTAPADYLARRVQELRGQPTDAIAAQAVADAELSTFNNPNALGGAWQAARRHLQKSSPGGAFAMDTLAPFVKVPTNVVARVLEYATGTALAPARAAVQVGGDVAARRRLGGAREALSTAKAAQMAQRGQAGYPAARAQTAAARLAVRLAAKEVTARAFTPTQQRAFAETFGRGSVGLGLMAIGYRLADSGQLTGYATNPEEKKRMRDAGTPEGSLHLHGAWHRIDWVVPFGPLMMIGATLRQHAAEDEGDPAKVAATALRQVGRVAGDVPMLSGSEQAKNLLSGDEGTVGRFLGDTAGSFVPSGVATIADLADPHNRATEAPMDALKRRVPGLRQTLTIRPGEKANPFNPFGSVKGGGKADPDAFSAPALRKILVDMDAQAEWDAQPPNLRTTAVRREIWKDAAQAYQGWDREQLQDELRARRQVEQRGARQ